MNNIKTIFKETEWNGEHWIYLPQYRIRKRQGISCRVTIFSALSCAIEADRNFV